jgi:hypothetical protein
VPSEGTACIARMWPSKVHTLKTVAPYFEHIYIFDKTFDVRRNDRGFLRGDLLVLAEWDDDAWTGRDIAMKIQYVLPGGEFGILSGFVVLGLAVPRPSDYSPMPVHVTSVRGGIRYGDTRPVVTIGPEHDGVRGVAYGSRPFPFRPIEQESP